MKKTSTTNILAKIFKKIPGKKTKKKVGIKAIKKPKTKIAKKNISKAKPKAGKTKLVGSIAKKNLKITLL